MCKMYCVDKYHSKRGLIVVKKKKKKKKNLWKISFHCILAKYCFSKYTLINTYICNSISDMSIHGVCLA